jgi:hypothetical protein
MVSTNSLFNSGNGFHFNKADSIYKWMIENFPASKYGYMGRLLVSHYTKGRDIEFYCKKILEVEPNFATTKPQSFFEQIVRNVIQGYL